MKPQSRPDISRIVVTGPEPLGGLTLKPGTTDELVLAERPATVDVWTDKPLPRPARRRYRFWEEDHRDDVLALYRGDVLPLRRGDDTPDLVTFDTLGADVLCADLQGMLRCIKKRIDGHDKYQYQFVSCPTDPLRHVAGPLFGRMEVCGWTWLWNQAGHDPKVFVREIETQLVERFELNVAHRSSVQTNAVYGSELTFPIEITGQLYPQFSRHADHFLESERSNVKRFFDDVDSALAVIESQVSSLAIRPPLSIQVAMERYCLIVQLAIHECPVERAQRDFRFAIQADFGGFAINDYAPLRLFAAKRPV